MLTTAVELERGLKLDLLLGALCLRVRLFGGVEAVDVRLVVLRVVELHNLARDVRLEGLRRVARSALSLPSERGERTHVVRVVELGKGVDVGGRGDEEAGAREGAGGGACGDEHGVCAVLVVGEDDEGRAWAWRERVIRASTGRQLCS